MADHGPEGPAPAATTPALPARPCGRSGASFTLRIPTLTPRTGRGARRRPRPSPPYALSRARAPDKALPANVAVRERERPSAARKRYAARNTPAAKNAKQAKATPAKRAGGKKPAPKKSTAKSAAPQPKPAPVRDPGGRLINRAALGYGSTDETKRPRTR